MVSKKSLDKYGEFLLLDDIVRAYPSYTHDDVFNLSLVEVYRLKLLGLDRYSIQIQENKIEQEEAKQRRNRK